ncbi:MAG: hypothetical protein GY719_38470, partial [bacterium]|nr:hypothetical protein [bacterium]
MTAYSIIFVQRDAGPCATCGAETGSGVIGWSAQEDRPLCDACLIEVSPHLGMVLNVALIFREVGGIEPDGDPVELVYQVLTLARIYESAAGKIWPARKPGLIEFARRLAKR